MFGLEGSWGQKVINLLKLISLEIILLCWTLPTVILRSSYEKISLEKYCLQNRIDKIYGKYFCEVLVRNEEFNFNCTGNNSGNLSHVIEVFPAFRQYILNYWDEFGRQICFTEFQMEAKLELFYNIKVGLVKSIPLILLLYAGPWSDKRGSRRPLMFFPMLGSLLTCSFHLLSMIYKEWIPPELTVVSQALSSLFGGHELMSLGLYSYLMVSSKKENRTMRFILLASLNFLVLKLGSQFSSIFFIYLGYINSFLLGISLNFVGLFFIQFVLKKIPIEQTLSLDAIMEIPIEFGRREKNRFSEFFQFQSIKECLTVFFKRRHFMRGSMILILLVYALDQFATVLDGDLSGIFMERFKWSSPDYIKYSFISYCSGLLGSIFTAVILSKLFKVKDAILILSLIVLTIASRIFQALAVSSTWYYAGMVMNIGWLSVSPILKSFISSKIVSPNEIGTAFSFLILIEALSNLSPVFAKYFRKAPDLVPWVGVLIYALNLILFIFAYRIMRKHGSKDKLIPRESNSNSENIEESKPLN